MEMLLTGNIRDISLVEILVSLNRNRKTGTLSLITPVFTKKMYISTGDVIFASSTNEDDRLGEKLLKADKITLEQYDQSVAVLKSSRNKRLGAILVELGYITPKDLFWGVKYQVREIIHSMFLIEDATYEFTEGGLPTQEVITLKMSMGNLILEGVKKIDNWTRIRNEMPDSGSVLKLSHDPLSLFQDIELNSGDKNILSLIDGRKSIRDVIEDSGLSSFEALKILYVLWSMGMVEEAEEREAEVKEEAGEEPVLLKEILQPRSEEEESLLKRVDSVYSRLEGMSMQELMEIDGIEDADLTNNYYRLAREFHPDRYFATADESVKSKLTAIFDALTKAYNTLKEAGKGKESLVKEATMQESGEGPGLTAGEHFKKGIDEFRNGNFTGAAENFQWATVKMPLNAGYWSYLALSYAKVPGRTKDAESALLQAIALEPLNADLQSNLGLIYLKAGMKEMANSAFWKALNIDPGHDKARKGFEQTKGA